MKTKLEMEYYTQAIERLSDMKRQTTAYVTEQLHVASSCLVDYGCCHIRLHGVLDRLYEANAKHPYPKNLECKHRCFTSLGQWLESSINAVLVEPNAPVILYDDCKNQEKFDLLCERVFWEYSRKQLEVKRLVEYIKGSIEEVCRVEKEALAMLEVLNKTHRMFGRYF